MGKQGKRTRKAGSRSSSVSHPFPLSLLHEWNDWLHSWELLSILADGVFWFFTISIGFFLAGISSLLLSLVGVVVMMIGGVIKSGTTPERQLAVLVTGCDTGFGKELVSSLTDQGFVVFCACLHSESMTPFLEQELTIPLQLDVTNDEDFQNAHAVITNWLISASKQQKRYLHAIVNNAGVGVGGRIDWFSLSDYQRTMNVNYFGIIRCIKTFWPILKQQNYENARVINVVSAAGLYAGCGLSSPYEASKHAVDALTKNLRLEMQRFKNVQVIGIYPSFHKTSMANPKNMEQGIRSLWTNRTLSEKIRQEYGSDYFQNFLTRTQWIQNFTWDSKHVVKEMEKAIVLKYPRCETLVGMDAKYFIAPLGRMLPTGLRHDSMFPYKPAVFTSTTPSS